MDRIILGNVSGEEFDAYFKNLNWPGRMAFVRSRRCEIAELANPKILDTLCDYGYFNALLPLVSADKEAADAQIISYYTPGRERIRIAPSPDDEREILKYAAGRLDVIRFLREKTMRFLELSHPRVPFRLTIYENATQDVADYLFEWMCRNHIPLGTAGTHCLFAKASPGVIRDYLVRVGCLSANRGFVSGKDLRLLAQRADIDAEDRHELLLLTVNRLKVSPQTIINLRRDGLFGFLSQDKKLRAKLSGSLFFYGVQAAAPLFLRSSDSCAFMETEQKPERRGAGGQTVFRRLSSVYKGRGIPF